MTAEELGRHSVLPSLFLFLSFSLFLFPPGDPHRRTARDIIKANSRWTCLTEKDLRKVRDRFLFNPLFINDVNRFFGLLLFLKKGYHFDILFSAYEEEKEEEERRLFFDLKEN